MAPGNLGDLLGFEAFLSNPFPLTKKAPPPPWLKPSLGLSLTQPVCRPRPERDQTCLIK